METKKILDKNGLEYYTGKIKQQIPKKTSDLTNDSNFIDNTYHDNSKQNTLVSGTNIKTINNESLLGSGNISISGGEVLPVGAEIDFDGDTSDIPVGWEQVANPDSYSAEEVKTNKIWIDGKPIYRKVYKVENKENSYGIARPSNVDTFTKLSVMQKDSSNAWIPAYYWASSDYLRIFATGDYIQIRTSKANNTFIHYIIIEYTKTTD